MFTVLCSHFSPPHLHIGCSLGGQETPNRCTCCDDVRPLTAGLTRAANARSRADYGVPETDYEKKVDVHPCCESNIPKHYQVFYLHRMIIIIINKKESKMKITYQAANGATQFFTSKARVTIIMMCLQRLKEVDFSPFIPIYVRYVHLSFSTHLFLNLFSENGCN